MNNMRVWAHSMGLESREWGQEFGVCVSESLFQFVEFLCSMKIRGNKNNFKWKKTTT